MKSLNIDLGLRPAFFSVGHARLSLAAVGPNVCLGDEMPRIKRWFRMSHDINKDPEMWEFRELVGKRADAIWQEILSIADRNEGDLPGPFSGYRTILAGACKSTPRHLDVAFEWLTTPRGRHLQGCFKQACSCLQPWVVVNSDGFARVAKWWKWNDTQEGKNFPVGKNKLPSLSYPSEPSYLKDTPSATEPAKTDPWIPAWNQVEKWLKNGWPQIRTFIGRAKKAGFESEDVLRALASLEAKLQDLPDIDKWAYGWGALQKIYPERQQSQSAKYKNDPEPISGILGRLK